MASRPTKSSLVLLAERLANLSAIDASAPGGAAYKAFMIEAEIEALKAEVISLKGGAK